MSHNTATFSVGQTVTVTHSSTRYNKRRGVITRKPGGGVYTVQLEARTRDVNGPTGHPRTVRDSAEEKSFKLGSLSAEPTQQPDLFSAYN